MRKKKDIRSLSYEEILRFCNTENIPKFRANQMWEWIWKKRAVSFEDMSSLPKKIRELLTAKFEIKTIEIHRKEESQDGTIKYSFQLHDNLLIEGVLIPSRKRLTACVSSQVGCSLACDFCATGTLKLERNLSYSEIYDQVFTLNQEAMSIYGRPLSNIVYMGMGEPLLNYKAVLKSINLITAQEGLAMSPKRITVSTAGIANMIKKLADEKVKFNLAISLHTAHNYKRDLLMPLNTKINLQTLKDSISYFYDKTGIRVTYEYILFKDLNDSIEDAKKLLEFINGVPCKINLIEYNTIDELKYKKSSNDETEKFTKYLEEKNIIVNLRRSKGKDIAAACGQLVNKLK